MPMTVEEEKLIDGLFKDDFSVRMVRMLMPELSQSSLYYQQNNFHSFGVTKMPAYARKRTGRPPKITEPIEDWLIQLLSERNDLWQEEMCFELWVKFDVVINRSSLSRFMKTHKISKKVNTRIAAQQDPVAIGVYLEEISQFAAQQIVYVDESNSSEKVLFRRTSWSQIGLPAFTFSTLRNSTRCSILPALDVDGYIPGCTLIVESSVTQAMFEHWLEVTVLPKMNQCDYRKKERSVLVMDNCSTHHSEKITLLCRQRGVALVYLPAYSPHLNPIELSFHLLKQWLRRYRDIAPSYGCDNYKEKWIEHLHYACEEWSKGVEVRELYRKAKIMLE